MLIFSSLAMSAGDGRAWPAGGRETHVGGRLGAPAALMVGLFWLTLSQVNGQTRKL